MYIYFSNIEKSIDLHSLSAVGSEQLEVVAGLLVAAVGKPRVVVLHKLVVQVALVAALRQFAAVLQLVPLRQVLQQLPVQSLERPSVS